MFLFVFEASFFTPLFGVNLEISELKLFDNFFKFVRY